MFPRLIMVLMVLVFAQAGEAWGQEAVATSPFRLLSVPDFQLLRLSMNASLRWKL